MANERAAGQEKEEVLLEYQTELMQEILKSREGREILRQISPIYGEGFIAISLFQAIGEQLDDLRNWICEYLAQRVPQTATWSLDYWESEFGISKESGLETLERRARILSTMRDRAPINPITLARIADAAGGMTGAVVEEFTGVNQFTIWLSMLPDQKVEEKIRRAVDRVCPAHLIYDIRYHMAIPGSAYVGGIIMSSRNYTLRKGI